MQGGGRTAAGAILRSHSLARRTRLMQVRWGYPLTHQSYPAGGTRLSDGTS